MKHSFKVAALLVLNILLFAQTLFGQNDCVPQKIKSTITHSNSGRRTVSNGSFLQTLDYSLSLVVSVYGSNPVNINGISYTVDSCVGSFIYQGNAVEGNTTKVYNLSIGFTFVGRGDVLTYLKSNDNLILLRAEMIRYQSPIVNNAVFEGFSYNRSTETMTVYISNPIGWYFDDVYQTKFTPTPIQSSLVISHYHQLKDKFAFKNPTLLAASNTKPNFNVAADDSEASIITFKRPNDMTIEAFQKLSARIREDPLSINTLENGVLATMSRNSDLLTFRYKHPANLLASMDYYNTIHLEAKDTVKNCPIHTIPIRLFRASVLMVHGLWSDDGAFSTMQQNLTNSSNKEYRDWQTHKVNYCSTNDSYFCSNSSRVFDGIDVLVRNGIGFSCAVGKVDVVCHSMGGILSRLYIQSPSYENDIRKLITTNTPHYGSPIADFVMEHNIVSNAACALLRAGRPCQGNCEDGALNDLRMEGNAIRNLNTGDFSSRKVAVHSIVTYRDLADVQGILDRINVLETIPGANMYALLRGLFGLQDVAESMGCVGNDLFDGEPNDLIVGIKSQKGGLAASQVTVVPNQMHMDAQNNSTVIQTVQNLLRLPLNSTKFSNYGYQPRPAGYGYSLNIDRCILAAAGFTYDQLSNINIEVSLTPIGGNLNPRIRIVGQGPPNLATLVLLLDIDKQHTIYCRKQGNSAVFDVDLPFSSFGNKDITIVGYDVNNRKIVVGKNTVNVQPPFRITSLRIDPSVIYVMKDKVTPIRVIGTDSTNKAYDLTNLAGLNFQFSRNYARREENGVFGVNLGTDNLRISYNGVSTDNIPVNVLDCRTTTPIPIELVSFTGKAHKERNQLTWVTASEHNNKGFFIERSADGQSWESIGWISGKGTSTAIVYYEFSDAFPLDIGYYRLQQLDFDGKITFSKVITLVQPSDNETIIYPNPARDYLTVEWQAENTEGVERNLSIVNAIGTTVRQLKTTAKNVQINVSNLPNGVYILRIEQANKAMASVKRFVLMK